MKTLMGTVTLLVSLSMMAAPCDASSSYIATLNSGPNTVAITSPFVDMGFALSASVQPTSPFDPPPSGPWLFEEITSLNSITVGQTWIADDLHPAFASFESFLTNGTDDGIFGRFDVIGAPGPVIQGRPESVFVANGASGLPGPDLAGWDLTEVRLTFDAIEYFELVIPGGPAAYGYNYQFHLDVYGKQVPAPGALALFGVFAFTRRRRR
jgi:hypothetical protein